jgi:hypothetical protein
MLKSRLKSGMAQGLFRAYCVTRARRFRILSAACLRVIRLRQSGQYLTLFEVDANAAPHSAHRRLSSALLTVPQIGHLTSFAFKTTHLPSNQDYCLE